MSINRELIGFWYPLCHWAYMEYINDPQSPLIASTERRRHSSLKWNLKWPTLIIIHCTSVSPLSNQNGWRPPIHDYSTVPSQAVHPARNMSVYTLFIHPQREGVRECHSVVRSLWSTPVISCLKAPLAVIRKPLLVPCTTYIVQSEWWWCDKVTTINASTHMQWTELYDIMGWLRGTFGIGPK